jgi:hypothetical protein
MLIRGILCNWVAAMLMLGGILPAVARPLTLVFEKFGTHTDSLWNFKTAAFRDGAEIPSPGREAEIPGTGPITGQLKIDTGTHSLFFAPKKSLNPLRSCFVAFRTDFRVDMAFASHLRIDVSSKTVDPTANDTLGGLYLLLQYQNENGSMGMVRSAAKVKPGQGVDVDTSTWISLKSGNWLSTQNSSPKERVTALSRITGVGVFYMSAITDPAALQPLHLGGIKVTGELRWPLLRGTPESSRIRVGDTLPLQWTFPSGLKARFRWFRNNHLITGVETGSFVFKPGKQDATVHVFRAEATLENGDILTTREINVYVMKVSDPIVRKKALDTATAQSDTTKAKPEDAIPLGWTLTAKAGINVTDFYRDESTQPPSEYRWSYLQVGVQGIWQFQPGLGLQSDLLFSRKGIKRHYPDHATTWTLDYLECPLLLRLRLGKGMPNAPLSLLAGGYGAYLINAEKQNDWGSWKGTLTSKEFMDWDYGACLGLSWQPGILSMEWRYNLGLADLRNGAGNGSIMMGTTSVTFGFILFATHETVR